MQVNINYPLSLEHLEYQALSSPSPESSISAFEQPYTQNSGVASSVSSLSAPESQPKKRKLRTTITWKHFRLPQADEEAHQSNQRLWYCRKCCNPLWRTVLTTSATRHMRNAHGIAIDEEQRPAKKALQQFLEVLFRHAE